MRTLADRRILITGAGSGLGRALALHFARNGWKVAASDRRLDAAAETAQAIQSTGGTAIALELDVTTEGAFDSALDQVEAKFGGVDALINNAGVACAGTVELAPAEQWRWVLDINLMGCVRGAKAVIPRLRKQGGGHIVNIASFAGIANPPAMASYNVAKAGVVSLSETLRFEVDPDGIGVSVACPSFFATPLMETSRDTAPQGSATAAAHMETIVSRLMQKADVKAEDVAADIYGAVMDNRFLVITHPDARRNWRLKRLSPELYFRMAQRATAKFLRPQGHTVKP